MTELTMSEVYTGIPLYLLSRMFVWLELLLWTETFESDIGRQVTADPYVSREQVLYLMQRAHRNLTGRRHPAHSPKPLEGTPQATHIVRLAELTLTSRLFQSLSAPRVQTITPKMLNQLESLNSSYVRIIF